MQPNNTGATFNFSSSAFYCRYDSGEVRDSQNTTSVYLTVAVLTFIPVLPTILMNAMVILAIKQKRELQRPSNILLSSLAVTDLLIGITAMPLFVIVNFLIFQQVWSELTCMLFLVNPCIMQVLFLATLFHLTIIAWERYVAIQKWMDYKILISNSRLKKMAIVAWISALFPAVPNLIFRGAGVNGAIIAASFVVWTAEAAACLILIAYFYRKVYLAIREHKVNEIQQVDVLVKVKLESKVARTTGLLTAALIFCFIPVTVFMILHIRFVFPVNRANVGLRITTLLTQFNSLFNPLLYCYRDRRFRNAIGELLRLKKPAAIQSAVGAAQYVSRKEPLGSSEDHNLKKREHHLTKSASCNLFVALDSSLGTSTEVTSKRSLSIAPLDECSNTLTNATIHAEIGVQSKARENNFECTRDVSKHETEPHRSRNTMKPRSRSWDIINPVKLTSHSYGTIRRLAKPAKTNFPASDKVIDSSAS